MLSAGEGYRDGRWPGLEKDECGIHTGPTAKASEPGASCKPRFEAAPALLNPAAYL
jgi:hypothetical protein